MQELPSEHVNMGPVLESACLIDTIWKKWKGAVEDIK